MGGPFVRGQGHWICHGTGLTEILPPPPSITENHSEVHTFMSLKINNANYEHVDYKDLNSRQMENYNFLKVSAVLADYGFMTMRLTDDWQGADFIAQHKDGNVFLKVQLKGRLTFSRKYEGKDIFVTFCNRPESCWYLYPHDDVLKAVSAVHGFEATESWRKGEEYTFPILNKKLAPILKPYRIEARKSAALE